MLVKGAPGEFVTRNDSISWKDNKVYVTFLMPLVICYYVTMCYNVEFRYILLTQYLLIRVLVTVNL